MNSTIERAGPRPQLGADSPVNEHRVTSRLHTQLNHIDTLKNRLVDLA